MELIKGSTQAISAWWEDRDQLELFKSVILGKDFTDNETKLALGICQRTGLDPISKQIFFIKRGGKMTAQTSIDGFRSKAEETGDYAGSDDPLYNEGLTQYAMLAAGKHKPVTATVTVWKLVRGVRVPFTATAHWEAYYVPAGGFWDKMPFLMLGKCAEALALRKAFPTKLGGLYVKEEMQQAGADDAEGEGEKKGPPPPTAMPRRLSETRPVPVPKVNPITGMNETVLAEEPILEAKATVKEPLVVPITAENSAPEASKETRIVTLPPPEPVKPSQEALEAGTESAKGEDQYPEHPKISEPQRKRFYAIYKGSGWTDAQAKAMLCDFGITGSKLIPRFMYEQVCEVVKKPVSDYTPGGA